MEYSRTVYVDRRWLIQELVKYEENLEDMDDMEVEMYCEPAKQSNLNSTSKNDDVEMESDLDNNSTVNIETSSQDLVLSIPLLQEAILQSLSSKDLKNVRLVNSYWGSNPELTKKLRAKNAVHFMFDPHLKTYVSLSLNQGLLNREFGHKPTLNSLTNLIKASESEGLHFPCSDFEFAGGQLNHCDLQKFLNTFGDQIQVLAFGFEDSRNLHPPTEGDLRHLFHKQIPNVVQLCFTKCPIPWKNSNVKSYADILKHSHVSCLDHAYHNRHQLQPEFHPLIKLKRLLIDSPSPVLPLPLFKKILDMARNLESVKWRESPANNETYFPFMTKLNKLYLIKTINLTHFKKFQNIYREFTLKSFPMRELTFVHDFFPDLNNKLAIGKDTFRPLAATLTQILTRSSSTLKKLNVSSLEMITDPYKIPEMTKLQKLRIVRDREGLPARTESGDEYIQNQLIFPPKLQLSKTFPALKKLSGELCSSFSWGENFNVSNPESDILPSVETIEFNLIPETNWLRHFTVMFPNTTTLTVGITGDIITFMEIVGSFCKLKSLEFSVIVSEACKENANPALDAAFTGFSKETCSQIYENLSAGYSAKIVSGRRERKSLLDFKCLQELKVRVVAPSDNGILQTDQRCITAISGIYAFQKCPKVRVSLTFVATKKHINDIVKAHLPLRLYGCRVIKQNFQTR